MSIWDCQDGSLCPSVIVKRKCVSICDCHDASWCPSMIDKTENMCPSVIVKTEVCVHL